MPCYSNQLPKKQKGEQPHAATPALVRHSRIVPPFLLATPGFVRHCSATHLITAPCPALASNDRLQEMGPPRRLRRRRRRRRGGHQAAPRRRRRREAPRRPAHGCGESYLPPCAERGCRCRRSVRLAADEGRGRRGQPRPARPRHRGTGAPARFAGGGDDARAVPARAGSGRHGRRGQGEALPRGAQHAGGVPPVWRGAFTLRARVFAGRRGVQGAAAALLQGRLRRAAAEALRVRARRRGPADGGGAR